MLIIKFLIIFEKQSKTQLSGSDNRIRTEFETTYKMSTYLAAWVVAPDDFSFINSTTKNGKQVKE